MVRVVTKIVLIVLFCSPINHFMQNDKIKEQNKELDKLRKEIATLESELSKKTASEKESLSILEKTNQKYLLVNKLVNQLKVEENAKESEIQKLNKKISLTNNEINTIKSNYSKYIVWLYKKGRYSNLKYIIDSDSFEQAMMRYRYLSLLTEQNEKNITKLNNKIDTLANYKTKLEIEKKEKSILVAEKVKEQSSLNKIKSEKQGIVDKLKKDKSNLKKEIEDKRKAEIKIKNLIAKLIEEESKKSSDNTFTSDANLYEGFENFSVLKGRLMHPVSGGKIVRAYGENKNEKLNTVTVNYGVDIRTNKNSTISAVADGIVSAIEWIPGYGSVIIVTHKNQYRTVYGHITDIQVIVNQKVKKNTVLGKVSESLEGNIVHFEIWKERDSQNPQSWFAKK
ncbi:MAG: peptidoglycan DD-metalloendopeptidase family protein [Ignavibacteriales bacterium]|nr:peptidoglycan DD-metalloendopeptidase family protein [Ignavibacteriales bacterium]